MKRTFKNKLYWRTWKIHCSTPMQMHLQLISTTHYNEDVDVEMSIDSVME
jgi:hypothetical protein